MKNKELNPMDSQVGGSHYKGKWVMQPLEAMEGIGMLPCCANAFKYTCRYKDKNGKQDLDKAIDYLDKGVFLGTEWHVTTTKFAMDRLHEFLNANRWVLNVYQVGILNALIVKDIDKAKKRLNILIKEEYGIR